jgi:hypothetical protein
MALSPVQEIEDLRVDIATLRALIDRILDDGVAAIDPTLRAAANVLYERVQQITRLEQAIDDSVNEHQWRQAQGL